MPNTPGDFALLHGVHGERIVCRDWNVDLGRLSGHEPDNYTVNFRMRIQTSMDDLDILHEDSLYQLLTMCEGLAGLCSGRIDHFDYAAWCNRLQMTITTTSDGLFLICMVIDVSFDNESFTLKATSGRLSEFRQGFIDKIKEL